MYYDEDAFLADESDFADLAFIEMPVGARVAVIDDVLADLTPARRRFLLSHPDSLGIEAEAHSIQLENPEELGRYLTPRSLKLLANAVESALLARLPSFA